MDCGAVANNMDHDPQQAKKETAYFLDDTILEAVKFLNYEKWSKMRFLCYRFNQLIQKNHSILQAFEVKNLYMEHVSDHSGPTYPYHNMIVSFNQVIRPAKAVRKWFQDRGYSCDETTDLPLDEVFAGMTRNLHFTFEASFEEPNRGCQCRGCQRTPIAVGVRSNPPELFRAKFNAESEFYGPILSYFFRLLHHPDAYFREISMFSPLTDKFCDKPSKNLIRCEEFTMRATHSVTLDHSLKWIKDNVRAQNIMVSLDFYHEIPVSEFHSLVLEFLLDASICAKDCITLDFRVYDPSKFITTFIEKYETLEITKPIPSIECCLLNTTVCEYLASNLVPQDDLPLYDKRCDKCIVKAYQLQNKLDGNRKMIAQYNVHSCGLYYGSAFRMRFE